MVSCSAIKVGKRRRKGRMFGVLAFVFPRNQYNWRARLSWKRQNICLPMGISKRIPCFAVLVCLISIHEIRHPPTAHYYLISDFLPHLTRRDWVSSCVKPQHWFIKFHSFLCNSFTICGSGVLIYFLYFCKCPGFPAFLLLFSFLQ